MQVEEGLNMYIFYSSLFLLTAVLVTVMVLLTRSARVITCVVVESVASRMKLK